MADFVVVPWKDGGHHAYYTINLFSCNIGTYFRNKCLCTIRQIDIDIDKDIDIEIAIEIGR
jgi:hypothetical protein